MTLCGRSRLHRSISASVATVGSARSVSAMTGSSAVGWVAGIFGDGTVRQPEGQHQRCELFGLTGTHQDGRQLGPAAFASAIWLLRTFSRTSMAVTPGAWSGSTWPDHPRWHPCGRPHRLASIPQWLVRRRRRREQPEHLRHHGAGLVHEDRISRGLSTIGRILPSAPMSATCATGRRPSASSPSCRPSALRWSIASTGVALRSMAKY